MDPGINIYQLLNSLKASPEQQLNGNTSSITSSLQIEQLLVRRNAVLLENSGNELLMSQGSRELRLTVVVIMYMVICVISLIGNLLICTVIARNKVLHTATYFFMLNLAVSDLVVTIINIPLTVTRLLMESWILGSFMCKLANLTLMCSCYSSTFTMAAIAWDKYTVIMHPFKARLAPRGGLLVGVLTWILGFIASLPYLIYSQVESVEFVFQTVDRCRVCYPHPAVTTEQAMTLVTLLLQFVLPISITWYAYGCIIRSIWTHKPVGLSSYHFSNTHLRRTRLKSVKMLMLVVLVFILCWLPMNLYHILTDFFTDYISPQSNLFLVCHWIAVSSACYNPIIYCRLHGKFRRILLISCKKKVQLVNKKERRLNHLPITYKM